MKLSEILQLVDGRIVLGADREDVIDCVFASDLMSDVLTITTDKSLMLITGLCNLQTIRTCEMSDIRIVLFVRRKKVTEEMKELAEENGMILMETNYSLFRASGILYSAGMLPLY